MSEQKPTIERYIFINEEGYREAQFSIECNADDTYTFSFMATKEAIIRCGSFADAMIEDIKDALAHKQKELLSEAADNPKVLTQQGDELLGGE